MGSSTTLERDAKRDARLAEEALCGILLFAMKRRGEGFMSALEAFNRPGVRQKILFEFTPEERTRIVSEWKRACYRLHLPFVTLMNEGGEVPAWGAPEIMDNVRRWFRQGNAIARVRQMERLHRLQIMEPKMLPRDAQNVGMELLRGMRNDPHVYVGRVAGFVRARSCEIVKRLREASAGADRLLVNSSVAVMKDVATGNKDALSDTDYLVRVARCSLGIEPADSSSWMNAEAVKELVHDVMRRLGVSEDSARTIVMNDVRACMKAMTLLAEEIRRVILSSDESWALELFQRLERAFFEASKKEEKLVKELPLGPSNVARTPIEERSLPQNPVACGERAPLLSIAG